MPSPTDSAAAFQAVSDYQREQIRLAFDPMLTPYVAPGYVYTPQEQYFRRLRELGYGVCPCIDHAPCAPVPKATLCGGPHAD